MSKPLTMTVEDYEHARTLVKYAATGGTVDAPFFCTLFAEAEALRASLAAAEAKLTAASKAAIDMMNRHRDVVLSLEARLADAEKHADELAVALGSVKWVQPMYNGSPSCSWCGNQEHLHKVECGLDKLVAAHAARRAARDGQEGTR